MNSSLLIACLALLLSATLNYGVSLTMASATTPSITNFYQDFSYCTCDLSPSLCDNYCCCDAACSSTAVAGWTSGRSCLAVGRTLQDFCNETSTTGFGVWSDLACVSKSNRGDIGYYYVYPDSTSITYPSVSKFSSITPSTITQQFQTAASGVTLGSPYSTSNPYLSATASTFFFAPQPGPAGICIPSPLNFTSTSTTRCYVTPSAANCDTLNSYYSGTLCLNGQCTSSTTLNITASTTSGTTCNNVLTGFTISYTLASSGASYTLSGATVTPSYSNVNFGSTVVVTVSQTATSPTSTSGNPGYQLGKQIIISPSLSAIGNPTTGVCYSASSASGSISILFGQPAAYTCTCASACSNSYYIDSLLSSTITIQKYASKSTEKITVSGTGSTLNGCTYQSFTLQIVYSYDGWELDPQYYIVGAKLVPKASPDRPTDPTSKFLQIQWIYVNPLTVNTPPNNLFYQYFSLLWIPLKQQFGLS